MTARPLHLKYLNVKGAVWFNPAVGLHLFFREQERLAQNLDISLHEVWNHRDFRRAKEIYAMSIVAMAMQKDTQQPWWIIKPETDPPDGVMGTAIEVNGNPEMHVREVEVVEHVSGDIEETIRKKQSGKHYEPNTVLICYVSVGGLYDLRALSQRVISETDGLDHVFVAFPGLESTSTPRGNVSQEEFIRSIYRVSSVQLKPTFSAITVNPYDDCKPWAEGKEKSFFIFRGLGKGQPEEITLIPPPKLY